VAPNESFPLSIELATSTGLLELAAEPEAAALGKGSSNSIACRAAAITANMMCIFGRSEIESTSFQFHYEVSSYVTPILSTVLTVSTQFLDIPVQCVTELLFTNTHTVLTM
jgi:hypothetical protein